jgi:hypothetical protein
VKHFIFLLFVLASCSTIQKATIKPFGYETLYIEGDRNSYFQDTKTLVSIFPPGIFGNEESGFSFGAKLTPSIKKTISYEVMFPENFDFVRGGKLPGICGGRHASGGNPAIGTNGFSARLMWRKDGRLVSYVYHVGQNDRYGDDFQWLRPDGNALFLKKGVWHKIKMIIRMNSILKKNGSIEGYVGEKRAFIKNDLVFRTTDAIEIDRLCFNTFFGGDDLTWAPLKEEKLYIKNLVVY